MGHHVHVVTLIFEQKNVMRQETAAVRSHKSGSQCLTCLKSAVAGYEQVLKNNSEMYSEKDLYVGKVLTVHQRTFELLEADEFTYQYMENNRHVYLMADWEAALKAIQAQLQGNS